MSEFLRSLMEGAICAHNAAVLARRDGRHDDENTYRAMALQNAQDLRQAERDAWALTVPAESL